jgi:hypothetical protein
LIADRLQLCVKAVAHGFPDRVNILRLGNRGAHTAQRMRWPENVRCVWRPPDGPELTPLARVWRDLKDALAWQPFPKVDAQRDSVGQWLQAYEAPTRPSLPS